MKDNKALNTSIDENIIHQLNQALVSMELSPHKKESMRLGILDRIENEQKEKANGLVTIRQNEGNWIQIAPKLKKKQLSVDLEKGTETFLLKAEPGAEIPAHHHDHDEFSLILEGSAHFESFELNVGDYHIAPKGSFHEHVTCPIGALIYLQSGLPDQVIT